MVNSGSFNSEGDPNVTAGYIQANGTSESSQSPSRLAVTNAQLCNNDLSETADSDLSSVAHAIESTTPTKTEFNSSMPVDEASNYAASTDNTGIDGNNMLLERELGLNNDGDADEKSTPDKTSLYCSVPLDKIQKVLTLVPSPTVKPPDVCSASPSGDIKVKPNFRKLLCLYCDRSFVSANLRQKHVERVHSAKQNRRVSSRRLQSQLTTTPCVYCDKFTSVEHSLEELFQHLIADHSSKYYACLLCKERFLNSSLFQEHNASIHTTTSPSTIEQIPKILPLPSENPLVSIKEPCGKTFISRFSPKVTLIKDEQLIIPLERVKTPTTYIKTSKTMIKNNEEFLKEEIIETEEIPVKVTRSKMKITFDTSKKQSQQRKSNIDPNKNKHSTFRQLRNRKMSVKTSKIVQKRSKRLQAIKLMQETQKKKRSSKVIEKKLATTKIEQTTNSTKPGEKQTKPTSSCINPYPEFDSNFRVKKITDHSIDNLKISSLKFDDVFDKAFFNRIQCNIQENLLHHIDGKLFKNEESENRISNFEKISNVSQEIQNANSDNFGCDISLNAVTPVTSLLSTSQFGEDPESQIEYGSKPSKKKTTTARSDEVHYKYFTRRKYQASILEHKENRDLSKLDMWTQLVIKSRQQKMVDDKKSAKEMLEYTAGEEYKTRMRREELNRILDRRGPFEDLREETCKKAALDKLNSDSPHNSISEEGFTEIREILNDMLNKVFDLTSESQELTDNTTADILVTPINNKLTKTAEKYRNELSEIPSYLNLRRSSSLPSEGEIDKSDKIALICSSQETEYYELPSKSVRGKNETVELTGEWARSRIYVCAACGTKVSNIKLLLEHKNVYHQYVWAQHYELVGNQSELYRHLSIPGLGKVGFVEDTPQSKYWKRSDARICTKCSRQCNALGDLHRHMLECGGDWTWMLARKKCKYRPFGAKSRRKRRGLVKRIHVQKSEQREKKLYKKTFDGPRQRPSDADSIQRMLANLPAKRATRKVMSLKDGYQRNNQPHSSLKPQTKMICGKIVKRTRQITEDNPIKPSNKQGIVHSTRNLNQKGFINNRQSNRRNLRSLNKVLASRILDTNSTLLVKRKLKALNNRRITRQISEKVKNVELEKADVSKDIPQSTEELPRITSFSKPVSNDESRNNEEIRLKRSSPRNGKSDSKKLSVKNMLGGKLNIKSFFPVKKKKIPEKNETFKHEITKTNNIEEVTKVVQEEIIKKTTKDTVNKLVRSLTFNKKKIKKTSVIETDPKTLGQDEEESANKTKDVTKLSNKRKLRNSFRKVINKVKKLKTDELPKVIVQVDGSPQNSGEINNKNETESNFLDNPTPDISEPQILPPIEKIVIPSASEKSENTVDIAPIVINFNSNKNTSVDETIFNLQSNNEKNLQAKGELNFDATTASGTVNNLLCVDTNIKANVSPLSSPKLKGKIRKPARGLNDCIAMLTSKLQQKSSEDLTKVEDPVVESTETLKNSPIKSIIKEPSFVEAKITTPDAEKCNLENIKEAHSNSRRRKQITDEIICEALDLSKKSTFKSDSDIKALPKIVLNSVDLIIQNVIDNNCNESKTNICTANVTERHKKIDDIIQKVIDNNYNKSNDIKKHEISLENIGCPRNVLDDIIDSVATGSYLKQNIDINVKKQIMKEGILKIPVFHCSRPVITNIVNNEAKLPHLKNKLKKSKNVKKIVEKTTSKTENNAQVFIETNLDELFDIKEVKNVEFELKSTVPFDAAVSSNEHEINIKKLLQEEHEPVQLENKVVPNVTNSDSEDELPLSLLKTAKNLVNTEIVEIDVASDSQVKNEKISGGKKNVKPEEIVIKQKVPSRGRPKKKKTTEESNSNSDCKKLNSEDRNTIVSSLNEDVLKIQEKPLSVDLYSTNKEPMQLKNESKDTNAKISKPDDFKIETPNNKSIIMLTDIIPEDSSEKDDSALLNKSTLQRKKSLLKTSDEGKLLGTLKSNEQLNNVSDSAEIKTDKMKPKKEELDYLEPKSLDLTENELASNTEIEKAVLSVENVNIEMLIDEAIKVMPIKSTRKRRTLIPEQVHIQEPENKTEEILINETTSDKVLELPIAEQDIQSIPLKSNRKKKGILIEEKSVDDTSTNKLFKKIDEKEPASGADNVDFKINLKIDPLENVLSEVQVTNEPLKLAIAKIKQTKKLTVDSPKDDEYYNESVLEETVKIKPNQKPEVTRTPRSKRKKTVLNEPRPELETVTQNEQFHKKETDFDCKLRIDEQVANEINQKDVEAEEQGSFKNQETDLNAISISSSKITIDKSKRKKKLVEEIVTKTPLKSDEEVQIEKSRRKSKGSLKEQLDDNFIDTGDKLNLGKENDVIQKERYKRNKKKLSLSDKYTLESEIIEANTIVNDQIGLSSSIADNSQISMKFVSSGKSRKRKVSLKEENLKSNQQQETIKIDTPSLNKTSTKLKRKIRNLVSEHKDLKTESEISPEIDDTVKITQTKTKRKVSYTNSSTDSFEVVDTSENVNYTINSDQSKHLEKDEDQGINNCEDAISIEKPRRRKRSNFQILKDAMQTEGTEILPVRGRRQNAIPIEALDDSVTYSDIDNDLNSSIESLSFINDVDFASSSNTTTVIQKKRGRKPRNKITQCTKSNENTVDYEKAEEFFSETSQTTTKLTKRGSNKQTKTKGIFLDKDDNVNTNFESTEIAAQEQDSDDSGLNINVTVNSSVDESNVQAKIVADKTLDGIVVLNRRGRKSRLSRNKFLLNDSEKPVDDTDQKIDTPSTESNDLITNLSNKLDSKKKNSDVETGACSGEIENEETNTDTIDNENIDLNIDYEIKSSVNSKKIKKKKSRKANIPGSFFTVFSDSTTSSKENEDSLLIDANVFKTNKNNTLENKVVPDCKKIKIIIKQNPLTICKVSNNNEKKNNESDSEQNTVNVENKNTAVDSDISNYKKTTRRNSKQINYKEVDTSLETYNENIEESVNYVSSEDMEDFTFQEIKSTETISLDEIKNNLELKEKSKRKSRKPTKSAVLSAEIIYVSKPLETIHYTKIESNSLNNKHQPEFSTSDDKTQNKDVIFNKVSEREDKTTDSNQLSSQPVRPVKKCSIIAESKLKLDDNNKIIPVETTNNICEPLKRNKELSFSVEKLFLDKVPIEKPPMLKMEKITSIDVFKEQVDNNKEILFQSQSDKTFTEVIQKNKSRKAVKKRQSGDAEENDLTNLIDGFDEEQEKVTTSPKSLPLDELLINETSAEKVDDSVVLHKSKRKTKKSRARRAVSSEFSYISNETTEESNTAKSESLSSSEQKTLDSNIFESKPKRTKKSVKAEKLNVSSLSSTVSNKFLNCDREYKKILTSSPDSCKSESFILDDDLIVSDTSKKESLGDNVPANKPKRKTKKSVKTNDKEIFTLPKTNKSESPVLDGSFICETAEQDVLEDNNLIGNKLKRRSIKSAKKGRINSLELSNTESDEWLNTKYNKATSISSKSELTLSNNFSFHGTSEQETLNNDVFANNSKRTKKYVKSEKDVCLAVSNDYFNKSEDKSVLSIELNESESSPSDDLATETSHPEIVDDGVIANKQKRIKKSVCAEKIKTLEIRTAEPNESLNTITEDKNISATSNDTPEQEVSCDNLIANKPPPRKTSVKAENVSSLELCSAESPESVNAFESCNEFMKPKTKIRSKRAIKNKEFETITSILEETEADVTRRRSRNAKSKALEHILDEALSELSESERYKDLLVEPSEVVNETSETENVEVIESIKKRRVRRTLKNKDIENFHDNVDQLLDKDYAILDEVGKPEELNLLEFNQDIRRSRRSSRKVSYNENYLSTSLESLDQESVKNKPKKKNNDLVNDFENAISEMNDAPMETTSNKLICNKIEKPTIIESFPQRNNNSLNKERKLNSDELFDLLKSSTPETNDFPKPANNFLSGFDEISDFSSDSNHFDNVFENILEIEENFSEPSKSNDITLRDTFDNLSSNTNNFIQNEITEDTSNKDADINISEDKSNSIPHIFNNLKHGAHNSKEKNNSIATTGTEDIDKEYEKPTDTYCEICNKHFRRPENLVKHKRTLTHISKLSEIEAKRSSESNKAREKFEDSLSESAKAEINITSILEKSDKASDVSHRESGLISSNFPISSSKHPLKLCDIIDDVLNKPVLDGDNGQHNSFSDIILQNSSDIPQEYRRYKSLGERKSFDSETSLATAENISNKLSIENNFFTPQISDNTEKLEKQITLLQSMIENQTGNKLSYIDEISVSSNQSNFASARESPISVASSRQEDSNNATFSRVNTSDKSVKNCSSENNFIKPCQYEEISEDSTNARNYDDQKSRKVLNRDEELFLECCSLLKSGSEISNYSKKSNKLSSSVNHIGIKATEDEPEWMEKKAILKKPTFEVHNEYSDNSRIPTPLGDSFNDEMSNSNTISSNWNMNKKENSKDGQFKQTNGNRSFVFSEISNKDAPEKEHQTEEKSISKFSSFTKSIKDQFQLLTDKLKYRSEDISSKPDMSYTEENINEPNDVPLEDNKKMPTKGALKVFEGLKVSIPTEELNMSQVLNNFSPSLRKNYYCETATTNEVTTDSERIQEQPLKTGPSNNVVRKTISCVKPKLQFGNKFTIKLSKKKLVTRGFRRSKQGDCNKVPDIYDFEETQDNSDVFSKPDFRSFRNKVTSKDSKTSNGESDNDSQTSTGAEAKSASSTSSISNAPIKKPKKQLVTKKKCMIMGRIFRNVLKPKIDDIPVLDNAELVENYVNTYSKTTEDEAKAPEPFDNDKLNEAAPAKEVKNKIESKKKQKVLKSRKRNRLHSDSTDDEFSINKTKKRTYRKNAKAEDNCINLEQELKECIGVASRKSQRKCTSGKQNVLVEYWSSDDSSFEALLESQIIYPTQNQSTEDLVTNEEESQKDKIEDLPVPVECSQKVESPIEVIPSIAQENKIKKQIRKKPRSEKKIPPKSEEKEIVFQNSHDETEVNIDTLISNRRKRAAADPLYHWSSSSEDESQDLIEVKPIREELDDDDDRPVQHGWIVGDSPKKLVTMLAQAKGKKTDSDCVKEQGKKRTNNSNS